MQHTGLSLGGLFRSHVALGNPLVLAVVVRTEGSTYRKPGAHMLIAADGSAAGLLSGGCLESDLVERAQRVMADAQPASVTYDSRHSDDLIWGLGLGCEGAMTILLLPLSAAAGYQPFAYLHECHERSLAGRFALVIDSRDGTYPPGTYWLGSEPELAPAPIRERLTNLDLHAGSERIDVAGTQILLCVVAPRTRLLVLGAGPDAVPLVQMASLLDWSITVADHRSAYATAERFPAAQQVLVQPAALLAKELERGHYDAAVVMSHHLPSDEAYLSVLAKSTVRYIGLLGPAPRRARLLHEIGSEAAAALGSRLYGPVGLDIGAQTPQTIALAIAAEIQAVLSGRAGRPFRDLANS